MLVAQEQRAAPLSSSSLVRGRVQVQIDVHADGSVRRGHLGVVVAPLMVIALLHMTPPRPRCRGLDEKASGTGVLAAFGRTSQVVQKPQ